MSSVTGFLFGLLLVMCCDATAAKRVACYECEANANDKDFESCMKPNGGVFTSKLCDFECGTTFSFDNDRNVKSVLRGCSFNCISGGSRESNGELVTCCNNTDNCNTDVPENPNVRACYTCKAGKESPEAFNDCLNLKNNVPYRTMCSANCAVMIERKNGELTKVERGCAQKCTTDNVRLASTNDEYSLKCCRDRTLCNDDNISSRGEISPVDVHVVEPVTSPSPSPPPTLTAEEQGLSQNTTNAASRLKSGNNFVKYFMLSLCVIVLILRSD